VSTSLDHLLESTRRYPLLTAAEEVELSRRIAAGRAAASILDAGIDGGVPDPDLVAAIRDADDARQRFLLANLRLVVSIARRIPPPPGMDVEDLVQEGIVGLEHAVAKFDGEKGYKFSTYATWWIRQAIGRAIDAGALIRVPTHRSSDLRARLRAVEGDPGRLEPEVARLYWLGHTSSLDQPGAGRPDGDQLSAFLPSTEPDPGDLAVGGDEATRVRVALLDLPERARLAIALRFGLDGGDPATFVQIGERLGVSPEAARRLVERSVSRLRAVLERSSPAAA
jgi:RNA polymerase primary sigma factor